MNQVRIGIIGLGTMGSLYAKYLKNGLIQNAVLTAIMVRSKQKEELVRHHFGNEIEVFNDEETFFNSNAMDAVIISTPHYYHSRHAIKAFEHGLHVLCDKPAGVYTKEVKEMNAAAIKSEKIFSLMFNQRTNPQHQKLRELIQSGELGEVRRINWIVTDWYRTQSYYDSRSWRGTWAGEGGGILINQSPHQLDLLHWITGMFPKRLRAFCHFGKYRNLEVEDDVTAYLEYENGATGVFITTIGEIPGTNRLEIVGDCGKIVLENDQLKFWRLRIPESQFNREHKEAFGSPEYRKVEIPIIGEKDGHKGIMTNFVNAITNGTPLLAPGEEGIKGLALSNAMQLSTWTEDWVDFPIDDELYYHYLQKRIAGT